MFLAAGELTDKYRVGIGIRDSVYAVWCKKPTKSLWPGTLRDVFATT